MIYDLLHLSATEGMDFMGGTVSVTFAPDGRDTQCIDVTILEDDKQEPVESFEGVIEPPANPRVMVDKNLWSHLRV